MALTATASPKISVQLLKALLLIKTSEARFVAAGDKGVEQRGGFGFERDVADLVADQQRDPSEPVELDVEPAGALRCVQALDPLVGGRERDAVAAAGGLDGQRDAEDASMSVKPRF